MAIVELWSSDECGWWWETSYDSPMMDLSIRSSKIGMVRVRYNSYFLLPSEGDAQSFVIQLLSLNSLITVNLGGLVYQDESDERILSLDQTLTDTYYLEFTPSNDLNPPIHLNNGTFELISEGYVSGIYYLYITSSHEAWRTLSPHYFGSIIASTESPDSETNLLTGLIGDVPVSAKYITTVSIKTTKGYELDRPLTYVEQPVLLLNTAQGSKRTILSGITSEFRFSGGEIVCGFVWQSDFTNCSPIYLAIDFETDQSVLTYLDQITLKSWVMPQSLDINKMIQSGRIDVPLWPARYFYTSQGSLVNNSPSGDISGFGLKKIFQISTESGVIGGVMPSVGDNVFVLLDSKPLNSLLSEDLASIGNSPIQIREVSALVKRPGGGPSLLIDLDSTESTMTTVLSQTETTTSSSSSTTLYQRKDFGCVPYPMTSFLAPLDDLTYGGLIEVSDDAYGRTLTINTEWNAEGTGMDFTAYTSDTDPVSLTAAYDSGGVDSLLTGPYFVFSVDIFIPSSIDTSTMRIDLYTLKISSSGPQIDMNFTSWFSFGFYKAGLYWILYSEFSNVTTGDFCTKFALSGQTLPTDTWINLSLIRDSNKDEYTWYIDNEIALDRRGRICGWPSESYWTQDFDSGSYEDLYDVSVDNSGILVCTNGKMYFRNLEIRRGISSETEVSKYYISDCVNNP
jgi:hypothetical protein